MNATRPRAALALLALASLLTAGCGALHEGPPSDHFDGTRFFNPGQPREGSPLGYLKLRLERSPAEWPASVPLPVGLQPPPARVNGDEARVTAIGHATLLVQVGGLNILTDPWWSERASPLSWAGPKRVTPPAFALEALPKIDVVLISHDHHDHLDPPTLRALDARDRPRVVVPLGLLKSVQGWMPASTVTQHDWGDKLTVGAATVHLEPMRHGSGRGLLDQQKTLWAAFVIEAAGFRIWHVGDTGYGPFAAATGRKHGPLDLAILPIGAYDPPSFMGEAHVTPAEAVKLLLDSGAARALAHHFDTVPLAFEPHGEAPRLLAEARRAAGLPDDRFIAPRPGEALVLKRRAAQ